MCSFGTPPSYQLGQLHLSPKFKKGKVSILTAKEKNKRDHRLKLKNSLICLLSMSQINLFRSYIIQEVRPNVKTILIIVSHLGTFL